jgi:hypothetical protein
MHRNKDKKETIEEGDIHFIDITGNLTQSTTRIIKRPAAIIIEQEVDQEVEQEVEQKIEQEDIDDYMDDIPDIQNDPNNEPKDKKDISVPDDMINDNIYKDALKLYNLRTKTDISYEKNKVIIESDKKIYYFVKTTKLELGDIPDVDKLIFTNKYNFKVKKNIIPQGIKEIVFGSEYNKSIEKDGLPQNLEVLEFKCDFNQDLIIDTSPRIEYETYICVLPTKLKKINLGECYNREIKSDSLPELLETLIIGNTFNKRMKYFPKNLKHLELGTGYQHIFREGELPETLENLILGSLLVDIKTYKNV